MSDNESTPSERITRYRVLADGGDTTAQIRLAWEYAWGDELPRDFDAAVRLLRQAEQKELGLARYYVIKLKIQNNDPTFINEVPRHYEAGFGPAYYLLAKTKMRGKRSTWNFEEAKMYLQLAVQDNHLLSKFVLWRISNKNIWQWLITLPGAIRLLLTMLAAKARNVNDPRVLF